MIGIRRMKEFLLSFGGLVALMIGIVVFPPLVPIIIMGSLFCCAWVFFSTSDDETIENNCPLGEESHDHVD